MSEADPGLRSRIAQRLGLNRNGLYYASRKLAADGELADRITAVLTEHRHYGYRRIAIELKVGKNRVRRVMRAYDLHTEASPHQRHYKQPKGIRIAPPNILKDEAIVANSPNHVWACDFTYLWCLGRWYYLATVIDVFSREIVGWSMSIHHDTKLILDALYDALSKQETPAILHFDRGSEYLSGQHLDLLERLEVRPSASAAGSPWQNGFQERFYGSFKTELGSLKDVASEGELFERVALVLNYYNTRRIHSKLKTNPRQFRKNFDYARQTLTVVADKVLEKSGA